MHIRSIASEQQIIRIAAWVLIGILTGSMLASAQDTPPERAIVTSATGDVTIVAVVGAQFPAKVVPFMTMHQGDVITLPEGASLKLLFFQTGAQETWKGERVLKIGASENLVKERNTWEVQEPQERAAILFAVQETFRQSVFFAPPANGATARAFPVLRELPEGKSSEITKNHTALKQQFETQNVIPDVYLLSTFAEYGQYEQMHTLLARLLSEYPENPVLLQWQKWLTERTSPSSK